MRSVPPAFWALAESAPAAKIDANASSDVEKRPIISSTLVAPPLSRRAFLVILQRLQPSTANPWGNGPEVACDAVPADGQTTDRRFFLSQYQSMKHFPPRRIVC